MAEGINLSKDQVASLQMAFNAFDPDKTGIIKTDQVSVMFQMMGLDVKSAALNPVIAEVDTFGSGEIKFEELCQIAAKFMEEDADSEAIQAELREAFRLYDKEGNGYITTDVFRDILHEIDDKLSSEELDMMIEEIDADGSGTLDLQEFMEAMTK